MISLPYITPERAPKLDHRPTLLTHPKANGTLMRTKHVSLAGSSAHDRAPSRILLP
ncbi:hypothetical protein M422DRAFT_31181, partial [Sphaerobolus stellatus SS14]